MTRGFPSVMSELRKERGFSQRKTATDLHISQALLSHYENGAREPGLAFVCRACDYFGVSADYLLGREERPGADARRLGAVRELAAELKALSEKAEKLLEDMPG